jgi:mannitol PTS system EIICBA or EIICB component
MGSSVVCVNLLKKRLRSANLQANVIHKAVQSLPADAKVVLVHRGMLEAARRKVPGAVVIGFSQYLNDPAFEVLVGALATGAEVLATE